MVSKRRKLPGAGEPVSAMSSKVSFTSLPAEIRLQIYEFAVAVDEPIRPLQVTRRSNKFVWGRFEGKQRRPRHGEAVWVRHSCEPLPLAFSSLLYTCWQVYKELAANLVFYRINKFAFDRPPDLVNFLAAITPSRRSSVRYISLMNSTFSNEPEDRVASRKSASILLSKCEGLRFFDLETILYRLGVPAFNDESLLQLNEFTQRTTRQLYPMGLKRFRLRLKTWGGDFIELTDPVCVQKFITEGRPPFNQVTVGHIQAIHRSCVALERRLSTSRPLASDPDYRKQCPSDDEVHKAITSAKLDLVGENRIICRKFVRGGDIPANCTRSKLKIAKGVTKWGTIDQHFETRYNSEGILKWDLKTMIGVRWAGTNIQCEVVSTSDVEDYNRTWENLGALMSARNLIIIREYYAAIAAYCGRKPRKWIATRVEEAPNAKDVSDYVVKMGFDWSLDDLTTYDKKHGLPGCHRSRIPKTLEQLLDSFNNIHHTMCQNLASRRKPMKSGSR